MSDTQRIPTSLKVVAALFIIGGISSLIGIIVSLLQGQLSLDFGILGLFIGLGLRRLSRTWRTWALVFTWMTLVVTPVGLLLFINSSGPLDFTLFGIKIGHVPKGAGIVGAVMFFLITVWQYRVLTRPDVRALFGLPPAG